MFLGEDKLLNVLVTADTMDNVTNAVKEIRNILSQGMRSQRTRMAYKRHSLESLQCLIPASIIKF
jgi:hypothetical protein